MRRLQLVEIEDFPWCPPLLRDLVTDHLRALIAVARPYEPALPLLQEALEAAGERQILDLASGAGGPWPGLAAALAAAGSPVEVRLSDRFPHARATAALRPPLSYHPEPIDATAVPPEVAGVRTMFSSFHHFPPAEAERVLRSAAAGGHPVAVFEALERTPAMLLLAALNALLPLALSPFIRPFRLSRLLFTYGLPLLPLLLLVDGLASCLRAYTPAELLALGEGSGAPGYRWRSGRLRRGLSLPVSYLIGLPPKPRAEPQRSADRGSTLAGREESMAKAVLNGIEIEVDADWNEDGLYGRFTVATGAASVLGDLFRRGDEASFAGPVRHQGEEVRVRASVIIDSFPDLARRVGRYRGTFYASRPPQPEKTTEAGTEEVEGRRADDAGGEELPAGTRDLRYGHAFGTQRDRSEGSGRDVLDDTSDDWQEDVSPRGGPEERDKPE